MKTQLIELKQNNLPADQNPAIVLLGGSGAKTKRTYRQALESVAAIVGYDDIFSLPWQELRYQHTQAIKQRLLEQGDKPATVNKKLSALRGVLKQAWLLGLMSAEDYHKAAAVKGATGSTLPAGRELEAGEISAVMTACMSDQTPAGVRDAAIFGMLYSCGLRRAEVVGLDLADLDQDTGELVIRGKGNKERTSYLKNGAFAAVLDWLTIRGDQPGALFHPINKGGKVQARRMTTQAIYNMLNKRAEQAGVKDFSPHDLRRSFVSHLLGKGADIATVSKMAGHASIETTKRYDRRGEDAKQEAAELLHVPYQKMTTG